MIIYKTTNLINGKFYIGKDSKNNPDYLGSGLLLKRAIEKYGTENFKKEILEQCSSLEELNIREIFWIQTLDAQAIGYNIASGGQGGDTLSHHPDLEIIRKTISDGLKNSENFQTCIHSEDWSNQQSENMKSDKWNEIRTSKKYREKQSKASLGKNNSMYDVHRYGKDNPNYGNRWTPEQREKMSNLKSAYYKENGSPLEGVPKSEKHKANISKTHIGKVLSESHKNAIRKTLMAREPINQYILAKNNGEEYKISEETREKMRKSNGGSNNGFATLYIFNTPNGNELKLISRKNVKEYFENKFGKVRGLEYRLFNFKEFNGYLLKEKRKANCG